jgi:aromatic ring-opening dioxygenase catalytic subunit (LigB family)
MKQDPKTTLVTPEGDAITRRGALRVALGATAALAPLYGCTPASATSATSATSAPAEGPVMTTTHSSRLPVAFIPHGGGPWPFVDIGFGDKIELDALAAYLRGLGGIAPEKPKAVLAVSAHWEERVPTVMTGARPPLLFDYYGFPKESYELTWPAPGDATLAARVRTLLESAGFATGANAERGFDHGTFVPLKLTYPAADVPTVQLSLKRGLDPAEHLAMGRALAPLRDEGVLIVGSGMSFHNLRAFGPASRAPAASFDAWLREAVAQEPAERARRLTQWASAPAARQAHPREEHLLPLMVAAGAALEDRARLAYDGTILGVRLSAFHFG